MYKSKENKLLQKMTIEEADELQKVGKCIVLENGTITNIENDNTESYIYQGGSK